MGIIWRREMKSYFLTPIGYVFCGMFLLLSGFLFFFYNIYAGVADMTSLFGNLRYVFMLITPILTMRLISEERRAKVDQLLLTSSCPVGSIVGGKFAAACTVLLVALLITGAYVAILMAYSGLRLASVLSGYIGTWLLGCGYVAIGLFMSSLTEKQISAAVMTYAANLILQLAETYAGQIVLPGVTLQWAASGLSLYKRYMNFVAGIVRFSDVVYFLSFCGVLVFLTVQMVERRRWS